MSAICLLYVRPVPSTNGVSDQMLWGQYYHVVHQSQLCSLQAIVALLTILSRKSMHQETFTEVMKTVSEILPEGNLWPRSVLLRVCIILQQHATNVDQLAG